MEKERIGFIGLGVMGRPMAENLIRSGFPLVAYNRSSGPVGELAAIGAKAAATAAQVAAESDVIITMLPDTPDVEHVYFGSEGLIHHLRPGTLLIDMTTASPEIARKIHQAALHKGADSLDAPVSGGDIGAQAGTLSIMAGGSGNSFERARPVFEALGKSVVHMGDAGAGQVTKACNQIVVALTIEAVGEALALAKKSGVDPAKVRDALLGGFAQSRVLDVHGLRSLEQRFEPGFRVRLHRKDLSIALRSAEYSGVSLPHTAQVFEMMNVLISRGLGDLDHSVLIAYLAE
jgi:2-hydroxy-3-oxopropionate reductase